MTDGKFLQVNAGFHDFINRHRNARTFVFYGGAGSGKSVFVMQWLLLSAAKRPRNILILRQWREVVRESVIQPFRVVSEDFGVDWENQFHKTERTLKVKQSRIVFGGLDNVEKYKGTNWDYIWIEEATDITASDYDLLNLRLGRDAENARFILTFNPIDEQHWLIQRFIRNKALYSAVHHSTYLDNYQFLSKQFITQIENLINVDDNFHRVYALGEPGILKDLIYTNWKSQSLTELPPAQWHCAGLDFGFNNPTAMVYVRQGADGVIVHEMLHRSGMTNSDLIDWLNKHHFPKDLLIYADSAEPNRIAEIKRAGFFIQTARKEVKDGIDFVKSQQLVITTQSANLIKEIRGYKWREMNDGTIKDEPVKVNDHLCDAMRYALYSHFAGSKRGKVADISHAIPIAGITGGAVKSWL